jgi:hypothetical protein
VSIPADSTPERTDLSVSVVIPSYNSADTIVRTLQSLLSQEQGSPAEIIVVDSSDDERTPRALEDVRRHAMAGVTEIRVLRLAHKTMPAIARNTGAAQAHGAMPMPTQPPIGSAESRQRGRMGSGWAAAPCAFRPNSAGARLRRRSISCSSTSSSSGDRGV